MAKNHWPWVLTKDRTEEQPDPTTTMFGDTPIHAVNPNDPDSLSKVMKAVSEQLYLCTIVTAFSLLVSAFGEAGIWYLRSAARS